MGVLITDHIHPWLAARLEREVVVVDVLPDSTNEDVKTIIHEYNGLIVSTKTLVNAALIDAATQLQFIARVGSGMEHIDVSYARSKGIEVYHSASGNANAVAEHAVGLLLALVRKIPKAVSEVQEGRWIREENRGIELSGRKIGIIGFGNTGERFARRLSGFGMEILVYDKYRKDITVPHVKVTDLATIQREAEIISFHVPLTAETTFYLDAAFIDSMNHPFYLLNTSRGKVVKTSDLCLGLQSGKVKGAALDVLENERLDTFSPEEQNWWQNLQANADKVIITPHIAGWTHESKLKMVQLIYNQVEPLLLL